MSEGVLAVGARCAVHADVEAAATCVRCGNYACAHCLVPDPRGEGYCGACGPHVLHAAYFRHAWVIGLIGAIYVVAGALTLMVAVQLLFVLSNRLAGTDLTLADPSMQRLAMATAVSFAVGGYAVLTGWKLRAFSPVARKLAIVPAAFLLLAFPIGTLLGGSAILLLLGPGGRFVFSDVYRAAARSLPPRKLAGVTTWMIAILLILGGLLIQQYGSFSRLAAAFASTVAP